MRVDSPEGVYVSRRKLPEAGEGLCNEAMRSKAGWRRCMDATMPTRKLCEKHYWRRKDVNKKYYDKRRKTAATLAGGCACPGCMVDHWSMIRYEPMHEDYRNKTLKVNDIMAILTKKDFHEYEGELIPGHEFLARRWKYAPYCHNCWAGKQANDGECPLDHTA